MFNPIPRLGRGLVAALPLCLAVACQAASPGASPHEPAAAVATGAYDLAESARLEACAGLEVGPEAELVAFAPRHKPILEALFWYGDAEQALAGTGERLEAVVSIIAVAVLLVITNWFFHKAYWVDWLSGFHKKRASYWRRPRRAGRRRPACGSVSSRPGRASACSWPPRPSRSAAT